MKNERHLSQLIRRKLAALLVLSIFFVAAAPQNAIAFGSRAFENRTDAAQNDFDKAFREARDLLDREQWARAAEKFGAAIEKYPNAKAVDAALYWLAFCYKKQNQPEKANRALDQLIERFPASSWASDARVMKMEIAAPLSNYYPAIGATTALPLGVVKTLPSTIRPASGVKGANSIGAIGAPIGYENLIIGDNAARAIALDRADEIKLAAFQSLLAADARRAIETTGEILKPDSKASETFKIEALRVLRGSRAQKIGLDVCNCAGAVAKEFLPLLRETLAKGFQNEKNQKIRKEIVYVLASQTDEQSADYLKKLYAQENDRELRRAIINSFSPPEIALHPFYEASAAPRRKIQADVLWEVVRVEKDSELRSLALTNLQRFPNWAATEQPIQTLAQLYDSERQDEPFKISIVRAFAVAKQKSATAKLLDIAKNDVSDKLRLEAIYALRNSKNPEVLKFLEDLIR